MTNKARLQAVLAGKTVDSPPHFELVFQLAKEAFGIEFLPWEEYQHATATEQQRERALQVEVAVGLVETYGWAAVQGQTRALIDAVGDRALVYDFNGEGTFSTFNSEAMTDFTYRMHDAPESLHAEARAKCDASIELAKRQRDDGVDFICINSDYGFNTGPFISPRHFAEYVTPYLTEIVAAIHALGLPAILHSDGCLTPILDQLTGTGLDGYQSVDPQGGMDIKVVRADYPDLILMGNVQCSLLQDSTEALIRASVRYCMTHGSPGGRYIFSSSNCIFAGMPLENYHIMLDEYQQCCRVMQTGATAG